MNQHGIIDSKDGAFHFGEVPLAEGQILMSFRSKGKELCYQDKNGQWHIKDNEWFKRLVMKYGDAA